MDKTLSFKEALQKAATYCSAREQCSQDIVEKLIKWGIEEPEISQITDYLKQQGFIDETRYVNSFIADKFKFNKWGKIKIAYALRQKGLSETVVDEALRSIDDTEYRNTLQKILENKYKSTKATDKYDMQAKLFRFAASRGFEPEIIRSALHDIK